MQYLLPMLLCGGHPGNPGGGNPGGGNPGGGNPGGVNPGGGNPVTVTLATLSLKNHLIFWGLFSQGNPAGQPWWGHPWRGQPWREGQPCHTGVGQIWRRQPWWRQPSRGNPGGTPHSPPVSRGLSPRLAPMAGMGRVDCCCCLSLYTFLGLSVSPILCLRHPQAHS